MATKTRVRAGADGIVRVVREPRTYEPLGRFSFFRDLVNQEAPGARERLDRHRRETEVDQATFGRQSDRAVAAGIEYRTNPNSTAGTGGEFVPPLWLIPRFSSAARAGRPFGDLLQPEELPAGVGSVHIPRMVVGSTTAVQSDGQAGASQDITTADANSQVVTIDGFVDVSRQLEELSPGGFDQAVFLDLNRAYNRNLELQLLTGTGSNGQLLGLTNVPGVPAANTVSGSSGTTIATVWPLLGQTMAAVGNNRLLPPEAWLMAPRRWAWIASSVDGSQRPIASPGNTGPHSPDYPVAGGLLPFGPVLGVPAYLDGAISAGSGPDTVFAVRPSDMFLFESAPRLMASPNPLAGTLQTRIRYYRYAAFISSRYPSGIGSLTSLPQPSNF